MVEKLFSLTKGEKARSVRVRARQLFTLVTITTTTALCICQPPNLLAAISHGISYANTAWILSTASMFTMMK